MKNVVMNANSEGIWFEITARQETADGERTRKRFAQCHTIGEFN